VVDAACIAESAKLSAEKKGKKRVKQLIVSSCAGNLFVQEGFPASSPSAAEVYAS